MKLHKSKTKAEPVSDAPANVAPSTLPDGHVWIDLLDDRGDVLERVSMPERSHGFRILYGGHFYEHVSDHADGTWQFERK